MTARPTTPVSFPNTDKLRLAIIAAVAEADDQAVLEDAARLFNIEPEEEEVAPEEPEPEQSEPEQPKDEDGRKPLKFAELIANAGKDAMFPHVGGKQAGKTLEEIWIDQGRRSITYQEWREIADDIDWGEETIEDMLSTLRP